MIGKQKNNWNMNFLWNGTVACACIYTSEETGDGSVSPQIRMPVLLRVKASGKAPTELFSPDLMLASRHRSWSKMRTQSHNRAFGNKQIFVKQEQTKICTGRCPALQGSDAERQGIQCEPYPKQNVLEMCSQPVGVEQKKRTLPWVSFIFCMTRTGIEPMIQPWEGYVLAAWPTGHLSNAHVLYHKFFDFAIVFLKFFQKI